MRVLLVILSFIYCHAFCQCGLQYNDAFDNCAEIYSQLKGKDKVDTNAACVKYQIKENIFLKSFAQFHSIKSLNLICNDLIADDFAFPGLRDLRIECTKMHKGEQLLSNLTFVKYLSINIINEKDNAKSLPDRIDSIRTLFIGKTTQLTFENKISKYTTLEDLGVYDISSIVVNDHILKLVKLKTLRLSSKLSRQEISIIAKLPDLICLSVNDLEDYSLLKDFKNLKELNLYGPFSKIQLEKIRSDLPNIKVVHWGKLK